MARPGEGASAVVAVTGASGFIGQALCSALVDRERQVRALVRRARGCDMLPPAVHCIQGSLEDDAALSSLLEGASVVVHAAGVVSARREEEYHRTNVDGTRRLLGVAQRMARPPRVIYVSSLAAREPGVSAYAASKRAAEAAIAGSALASCVVRPPAVYGPRDQATLPIFRQLTGGLLIVPRVADARFSLLFIEDLTAALCRLVDGPAGDGEIIEPDDGRSGGYRWADLAAIAGSYLRKRVRCLHVPRQVAWCAALADEAGAAILGRAPTLSRGKLGELWYPDWVCRARPVPALGDWKPRVGFAAGFRITLSWYRRRRWL